MGTATPESTGHFHAGQPLVRRGVTLEKAKAAVVLLHGRGASAEGIVALADELDHHDVAYLAPQARNNTWYPLGFMAPIEANEPSLSSALATVSSLLHTLEEAGLKARQTVLLGFSQGACLALEFAARNARRYGGIVGFTGGLIGPPGTTRDYAGSLDGTPAFLGSSIPDPHVPWERVQETAAVLERLGATVDLRGYDGMPHTINAEEIDAARAILGGVVQAAEQGTTGAGAQGDR